MSESIDRVYDREQVDIFWESADLAFEVIGLNEQEIINRTREKLFETYNQLLEIWMINESKLQSIRENIKLTLIKSAWVVMVDTEWDWVPEKFSDLNWDLIFYSPRKTQNYELFKRYLWIDESDLSYNDSFTEKDFRDLFERYYKLYELNINNFVLGMIHWWVEWKTMFEIGEFRNAILWSPYVNLFFLSELYEKWIISKERFDEYSERKISQFSDVLSDWYVFVWVTFDDPEDRTKMQTFLRDDYKEFIEQNWRLLVWKRFFELHDVETLRDRWIIDDEKLNQFVDIIKERDELLFMEYLDWLNSSYANDIKTWISLWKLEYVWTENSTFLIQRDWENVFKIDPINKTIENLN